MATPNILLIDDDVRKAGIPVKGSVGVVVVRPIAGTNRPSQHSFGNATDYYPTDPKQAADAAKGIRVESLERLYQFLKDHPLANTVCYYKRGGCTTDHLDHVHVDASPKVKDQKHLAKVIADGPSRSGLTQAEIDQIMRRVDTFYGPGSEERNEAILDQVKGQNAPVVGGGLVPIVDAIAEGDLMGGLGTLLATVTSGDFVKRAGLVIGGGIVAFGGLYFIGKEFGLPSVSSVAGKAAAAAIPG